MKRKKVKRFFEMRIKDELGKAQIAMDLNMGMQSALHQYTASTLRHLMHNITDKKSPLILLNGLF